MMIVCKSPWFEMIVRSRISMKQIHTPACFHLLFNRGGEATPRVLGLPPLRSGGGGSRRPRTRGVAPPPPP